MNFHAAALLLILAATPVMAGAKTEDCGTIIIPPGLGGGPGADVDSLNPIIGDDTLYNTQAGYMMFEQLLWLSPDHTIDWSRSIATSVTSPDNGKTYVVSMRPWHWSDGVPVTAQDVAYTLQLARAYGDEYPMHGTAGMPEIINSFTITDPEHFTITLTQAVNETWFILNGLAQLMPTPQHDWSHYTPDQIVQLQSTPSFYHVVDGPVRISRLDPGLDAVFVPNPTYEGQKVHFDRLILAFTHNEDSEIQAVESNQLDAANIPFALWDQVQHVKGTKIVPLPPSYAWHELIPNMANPSTAYFGDVRVRQAIADAINQPQMIQLAMHGQGVPVYGPVPPIPATFLSPDARAGKYPVGYDPAKARALLKQAGFTPGPDGIMEKNGRKIEFTVLVSAGQPMRIEMAEAMQQNLRAVGIIMHAQQMEFNQIEQLLVHRPQAWQAILIANTLSAYPSGESQFITGAFYNNNGYADATMDKYVTASTNTQGLDGLFAYQDFASEQQPVIFLGVEKYGLLAHNRLQGLENFVNPLGYFVPEDLYCTAP
jgi:peptide/nickel transport system substrate-binding protein